MILKLLKILRRITTEFFKKKNCPICNARFLEFEQCGTTAKVWETYHGVGAGARKAICPVCKSSDRERLVYLYFRDVVLKKRDGGPIKILHIAPEANLSKYLMEHQSVEYNAADKRCDGYEYPDYVGNIDIMDMRDISDNSYDFIICNHVLEHVPDDLVAMKEILRILKPEGTALLQVPYASKLEKTIEDKTIVDPEARYEKFGQSDHVRLYGMDYTDRLGQAGFKVEVLDIASKYPKKYGLNSNEKLFLCHK